jgi:hypothetical protein
MLIFKDTCTKLFALILMLSLSATSHALSKKEHYTDLTVSLSQHLTQTLYFQGIVTPFNTNTVIAPFDGIITKPLGFNYGQIIKKDQYLLTIRPTSDTDSYRDALIAYLNAKSTYSTAKQKFTGQQLMYENGLLAKNDFTDIQNSLVNQKITLDQTLIHLQSIIALMTPNAESRENVLNSLKNLNLNDSNIGAVLTQNFAEVSILSTAAGVALSPPSTDDNNQNASRPLGMNSTVKRDQALVIIGNLTGIKVNINVEELNINKLVKGQPVTVTGPAFGQFTLQGSVHDVSYQNINSQYGNSTTYPATVIVPQLTPEQEKIIRSGMTATVAIAIPQPDAILIPINAIIIKDRNSYVLKKVGGKLVQTPVTTGLTTLNQITITSGLEAGDTIAIID